MSVVLTKGPPPRSMVVVNGEYPPMIDAIDAKFKVRGEKVIFAWGSKIYNPMRIAVPPELEAHELVHGQRQWTMTPATWWVQYIDDVQFRLLEECLAHKAEYEMCIAKSGDTSRRNRRMQMAITAKRLCSPIYQWGGILDMKTAIELLKGPMNDDSA